MPWHLLATLKLDGKSKYECQSIIFLNRLSPHFKRPDGQTVIKDRTVKGADGELRVCGWLFKEVGIETVFNKMRVAGEDSESLDEANELASEMDRLGEYGLEDGEEKAQAGQIEISFERITLSGSKYDTEWFRQEDQDMGGYYEADDLARVSHTTAHDYGTIRRKSNTVIEYRKYDEKEESYAIFKFYYRSEEKLRTFNFPGLRRQDYAATHGRRRRQDAITQAAAVPMGIVKPPPLEYYYDSDGEKIMLNDAPASGAITSGEDAHFGDDESWKRDEEREWKPASIDVHGRRAPKPATDDDGYAQDASMPSPETPTRSGQLSATITPGAAGAEDYSSADETSPLTSCASLAANAVAQKQSTPIVSQFRMMDSPPAEGNEADDEISGDSHTPDSITGEDGSVNDEDLADDGLAQNTDDTGLGVQLGKLELGKRPSDADCDDEELDCGGFVKKAKTSELARDDAAENALGGTHVVEGVGKRPSTNLLGQLVAGTNSQNNQWSTGGSAGAWTAAGVFDEDGLEQEDTVRILEEQ